MRTDILKDENNELLFEKGDFAVGQSDRQHVGDIFIAQPGEYKENPPLGFGAINYLKTRVSESEFKRNLKIQLEFDGYPNPQIDTTEGIEKTKITI